jgi:hypothetical protein
VLLEGILNQKRPQEKPAAGLVIFGAPSMTRTCDTKTKNKLLMGFVIAFG